MSIMTQHKRNRQQSGFVSIFSILFFIILATIIAVGFLRVVVQERQQSIDNSSSAAALAAARSGVEDAKRAIILYNTTNNPSLKGKLETIINGGGSCTSLFADADVGKALGLDSTGRIKITGLDEQYYSCIKIMANTNSYESTVAPRSSVIIPLVTTGTFNTIKLEWHDPAKDGNIDSAVFDGNGNNPTQEAWLAAHIPTYMRVQLLKSPAGATTDVGLQSGTSFLPVTVSAVGGGTMQNVTLSDDANNDRLQARSSATQCSRGSVQYACSVLLTGPGLLLPSDGASLYFLRVTALYGQTHFRVTASSDNGSTPVPLKMVQPEIDSTGRSGNTLRRLKARVRFTSDVYIPEFVAEANGQGGKGKICKDFSVSASTLNESSTCPLQPTP